MALLNDDLAVHEPDHKRLVAFLKAMEFNGLTRRVAEFASVDPGAIEAEARFAGQTGAKADAFSAPVGEEGVSAPRSAPAGGAELSLPLTGGGSVTVDYRFYWEAGKANMKYSIARNSP